MSNQHDLKIHPSPLADLMSGAKTAEVRRNDRGFQVGDTVRLMEVNPETGNWTGAADHVRTISHIQTGYGLPDGMCVLSYAQSGMELAGYANFDRLDNMLDDRTATVFPDRSSYAGTPVYRARAALAIQPAAGEPVAWMTRPLKGSHKGIGITCKPDASLNLDQWEKPFPVYAAPPAAAHGDEALEIAQNDLARTMAWVEKFKGMFGAIADGSVFYLSTAAEGRRRCHGILTRYEQDQAAMRAQGDGGAA